MSTDWYRRHLAPAPAPTRDFVPRQELQPTRFVVDGGRVFKLGDDGQPAEPQYEQPAQPWRQNAMDPPLGQMHALDAAVAWKGTTDAQRTQSGACPHCGSKDYMPRLPSGRLGHCFACGYRPDTGDDRGGPTMQPRNSGGIISENGEAIPVERARSHNSRQFGKFVSGRLSQKDIVGRAG